MCTWLIQEKGLTQERKQTVLAKGWVKKKMQKQELGRAGPLTYKPVKKIKKGVGVPSVRGTVTGSTAGTPKLTSAALLHQPHHQTPSGLRSHMGQVSRFNPRLNLLLLSQHQCHRASVGLLQSSVLSAHTGIRQPPSTPAQWPR